MTLLESIRLQNFRGFEDHLAPLCETTIVVGANNAGKSTIVEALRLVALVTDRFRRGTGRFVASPNWLNHSAAFDGLSPSVRGMPSDGFEATIFHRYGPPPAILTATFESGASVMVFVGPEAQIHGVARRPDGAPVTRATAAHQLGLEPVAVQPQGAPLLREERLLQSETVNRGDGTYLAPQHFRNQLWLYREFYKEFCAIAESTWPDLQIKSLDANIAKPADPLRLLVRDNDFVGEVSLMGHGLQMWLQIVWFLARAPTEGTIVLDEPDVYMHPDLQRRLLDLVRSRFRQLVIATHSVEILSDVDPRFILSVDRRQRESSFVTSLPGLQEVLDKLGSVQNIQVTRLMRSRSFFLVEGDDVKLLRIFQSVVQPEAPPIDLVPHASLGGRGGWGSGIPARLPDTNAEGTSIRAFALLDRDYFPPEEVSERYDEARQWKVQLHIWVRKEIENYLLVPEAIARYIAAQTPTRQDVPDTEAVAVEIDRIIQEMRDDVILDSAANVLFSRDKKGGLSKASKAARRWIKDRWQTQTDRWAVAPGKEVISQLSEWAKTNYGVSFGAAQIARTMTREEIDAEVVEVLSAIAAARPLKPPFAMPK